MSAYLSPLHLDILPFRDGQKFRRYWIPSPTPVSVEAVPKAQLCAPRTFAGRPPMVILTLEAELFKFKLKAPLLELPELKFK